MPVLRSQAFGDLFIEVFVETPVNLSRKQKDLLKQFAQESSEHTHPETTSFADKLKSLTEADD